LDGAFKITMKLDDRRRSLFSARFLATTALNFRNEFFTILKFKKIHLETGMMLIVD
jgi:hypothetical protein